MFSIPNYADAAFASQSGVYSRDVDALASALNGHGVIQGCAVAAHGPANMSVDVAVGTVQIDGKKVRKVAAGNVAIGAADAANPRFDLVCVDKTGAKQVIAGAAAANPVFPAITAGYVLLAAVYVPATDAAIDANQIIDKRFILAPDAILLAGCSRVYSDFGSVPDPLYGSIFNGTGGSVTASTSTADELGVADLNSSATSGGEAAVGILTSAPAINKALTVGSGAIFAAARVRTETNLSGVVGSTYAIRVGPGDQVNAGNTEHTNGIFFRYTDSVNAGKWQCVCRAAGVETAADSGVAVAALTSYLLEIEIAADGSSATFYINGAQVAQVVTNIPAGAGAQLSFLTRMCKTNGSALRHLFVDKMDLIFLPLNPY